MGTGHAQDGIEELLTKVHGTRDIEGKDLTTVQRDAIRMSMNDFAAERQADRGHDEQCLQQLADEERGLQGGVRESDVWRLKQAHANVSLALDALLALEEGNEELLTAQIIDQLPPGELRNGIAAKR